MGEVKQETFVERLIEEKAQLKEKLIKLNVFLKCNKFNELDDYQKSLLIRQREAMCVYFETLCARLELNKND